MSLTQLVALGAPDAIIYSEPSISTFKSRFASSTPFATETIRMDFTSYTVPGRGSITIPRKADMLMGVILQAQMKSSSSASQTNYPIENLVKHVELYIGGQLIEKYDNNWIRLRNTVLIENTERDAVLTMENFSLNDPVGMVKSLWLQLPFWFNETNKSLPLVALQYHEIRIDFVFENPANIPGIDSTYTPTITAWGEYAFLPPKERKWFASNPHSYIMEQTQTHDFPSVISTTTSASTNYTLPFNLPTKFLFWVYRNKETFGVYTGDDAILSANENAAPLQSAKIQVNGIDRFAVQQGSYFRLIEPYRTMKDVPAAGIYTYFFSKDPLQQMTISGTLNFSALDTVKLMTTTKTASAASLTAIFNENTTLATCTTLDTLTIIARSVNILRIYDGMGGIMFAN